MRHSARQCLWIPALFAGVLAVAAPSSAQHIVGDRLWCGASSFTLNDLAPSAQSASEMRAREGGELLSLWEQSHNTTNPREKLPGFSVLGQLVAPPNNDLNPHRNGLIRLNALRVLAHDTCWTRARAHGTSIYALRQCLTLIAAEQDRVNPSLVPTLRGDDSQIRIALAALTNAMLTSGIGEIEHVNPADNEAFAVAQALGNMNPPQAGAPRVRDAYYLTQQIATATTRILAYYEADCGAAGDTAKSCGTIPNSQAANLATAIDDVIGHLNSPPDRSCAVDVRPPMSALFCPQATPCQADLMVVQTGQAHESPRHANVCVNTLEFSSEEPIYISFESRTHYVSVAVFSGVSNRLPEDAISTSEVTRMTLRGRPNGFSLAVLADRPALPPPAGTSTQHQPFQSLVTTFNDLERRRAALASDLDLSRAAGALHEELDSERDRIESAADLALSASSERASNSVNASARAALTALRLVIVGRAWKWLGRDLAPGALPVVVRAVSEDLLPATPTGNDWSVVATRLRGYLAAVANIAPSNEQRGLITALNSETVTFDARLEHLCRLATTDYPLLVHDIAPPTASQIIDYDFNRGFVSANHRYFDEELPLFLRVANVPGNWALSADVGQHAQAIMNSSPIVGLRPGPDAGTTNGAAAQTEPPTLANTSTQFSGTRIINLGRLPGGRSYTVTVKAQPSGDQSAASQRQISVNQIDVNGYFHFGGLAGFGASMSFPGTPVPVRESASSPAWVTSTSTSDMRFNTPLLLVYYFDPRRVPESDFHLGVGFGLDLLAPTERFYLPAFTAGIGGVSLALGGTLNVGTVPRVGTGVRIDASPGSQAPDLTGMFGTDSTPRFGVFGALTFDVDLFRVAFNSFFASKVPGQ